jgi:hypothetical protein
MYLGHCKDGYVLININVRNDKPEEDSQDFPLRFIFVGVEWGVYDQPRACALAPFESTGKLMKARTCLI